MDEVSLDVVKATAKQAADNGEVWHFHILTPTCLLNERTDSALIVELPEKQTAVAYFSPEPQIAVGKELSPLLHKVSVEPGDVAGESSGDVAPLVARATELTDRGIAWHHHVLFPGCIFNESERFTLIVEDPERQETLRLESESEPTSALEHIEPLFYSQKPAN